MAEYGELDSRFNEQIEGLKSRAQELHTAASGYDLQIEYLNKQKALFEEYGAKVPIAMQCAQFMIEQIAAAASLPTSENPALENSPVAGIETRVIRPRGRPIVSRGKRADRGNYYNIAPQVKPIMNGIFGRGMEDVPEHLESLFDKMYGQQWRSRTIDVPTGPSSPHLKRTYSEDLHADDSYIKLLINGADLVINRNMRGSTPPDFPFRGRVAAVELVQLYNKIDAIGWDVYDGFMLRNRIRLAEPPRK